MSATLPSQQQIQSHRDLIVWQKSMPAIAKGSLRETDTFVLLAVELGYVARTDAENALSLMTEVRRDPISLSTDSARRDRKAL